LPDHSAARCAREKGAPILIAGDAPLGARAAGKPARAAIATIGSQGGCPAGGCRIRGLHRGVGCCGGRRFTLAVGEK